MLRDHLGDYFLVKKHYFLVSIEPLYFLKPHPIFNEPSFINLTFYFFSMSIFGQKSCILEPAIFEIPQPNWYQCVLSTYMQLRSNETRLHLILWQGWSIFANAFSQKNFTPFKPIHFLCNVSFPLQVFWSQNIKSSLR